MDGKAVKAIREEKRMSQTEFAKAIGVSQQTIQAVETGRRSVSERIRYRISALFDADETIEIVRRARLVDRLIL
ncbi:MULTISPECIES: helix-turn-helix transcriptional regulator [unclassified Paenibacillus]|uniref:helix-turn-helix transcriptional regulator n=1 Tax=unclassified Paenibacillus TaxID=185978 RepID=UPI003644F77C